MSRWEAFVDDRLTLGLSIGLLLAVVASVIAFAFHARRRRSERAFVARLQLRADFIREIVIWRDGSLEASPDGVGALLVRRDGASILVRDSRTGGEKELALVHDQARLGPLRVAHQRWRFGLFAGDKQWTIAAAELEGAATLSLRDLIGDVLGVERPAAVFGSLAGESLRSLPVLLGTAGCFAVPTFALVALRSLLEPHFLKQTPVLVTIPIVVVGAILVLRRDRRRVGRVELHDHGIVVIRDRETLIEWERVGGYDDGASDVVQLIDVDGARAPVDLAVPTLDEEARTAVLALLDEKGIRRRDTSG